GTYYYDGAGVKKDYSMAIKWYEMAALLGDQWSKNRLGEMYRDGKGTTPNMEKAMKWLIES
ncbi:tetratricopeptide repeat protein, partial [Methanomethylophilus alvi]|uniref:tetratricopeptide repeat protein n=1 Tax=Methanomethylophilus alvi TaxID=1291540 RepID=UPI0037DCF1FD